MGRKFCFAQNGLAIVAGLYCALTAGSFAQPPAENAVAVTDPAVIARGQRLFLRCASCHDISDSGITRIGPSLNGVVGRKAGSLPGYAYSPAMKSTTFVWDEAMLNRWLIDPAALVPGTAMAFAGMPKEEDRTAIIAYLRQPKH